MADAVPMPSLPPSVAILSTDLVVFMLQFLGAKDTARMCRISSAFHHLVQANDEALFRPHVLRQRLVSQPIPLTPQQNLAAAHTLRTALAPPGGWKGLYHVTKYLLGVPCLGYFRRVPRDFGTDYKGQLMRLRPTLEVNVGVEISSNFRPTPGLGLSLEVLTPTGTSITNGTSFFRLCEQRETAHGLCMKGRTVDQKIEIEWCAHIAVRGHEDEDDAAGSQNSNEDGQSPCFDMTLHPDEMVDGQTIIIQQCFHALLSEPPSLMLCESAYCQELEGLRGFWVGTYGSHGQEIIQVRFTTTNKATATTTDDVSTTAGIAVAPVAVPLPVIMEGIKIVGDANVPANEWSFRVDVSTGPLDKARALGADMRPVYTLDSHMQPRPRILSQEAGRIQSVYRGKGQINMVPGIWSPQEVGVDVVVLRPEENEGKGGLWVIWHDVEYTSRHCIDLTRLVETKADEEHHGQQEEDNMGD
ncbi:Hypothetical protein NocV09_03300630 [Nannochloropsis oceanica]